MQEKIIEIIVHILSEIRNSKHINELDLNSLKIEGYTDAEINSAFAWLYSKIDAGESLFVENRKLNKSHRFFHKSEKNILTLEAIGYLIQLKELNIISDLDEELILDKVFFLGYQKADVGEIKLIVASLIFNLEDKSDILGRLILQNNETVN
ncbi:hypothetical protein BH10BAC5_BH10BAC5_29170 [soil metagenome]